MKESNSWALFYTTIAIILLIAGCVTRTGSYLYGAIILAIISFYWLFRDQIIKKFRKK